jgi:hypothetical protein
MLNNQQSIIYMKILEMKLTSTQSKKDNSLAFINTLLIP